MNVETQIFRVPTWCSVVAVISTWCCQLVLVSLGSGPLSPLPSFPLLSSFPPRSSPSILFSSPLSVSSLHSPPPLFASASLMDGLHSLGHLVCHIHQPTFPSTPVLCPVALWQWLADPTLLCPVVGRGPTSMCHHPIGCLPSPTSPLCPLAKVIGHKL